jgi:hypothetical protein
LPDNTSGDPANSLASWLAPEAKNRLPQPPADADLARVVEAWPSLPEAIRRAVLALVETVGKT